VWPSQRLETAGCSSGLRQTDRTSEWAIALPRDLCREELLRSPRRTVELMGTRIVITPILMKWYKLLSVVFPGTRFAMVAARVACDQLLWAPVFMVAFFPIIGMSRGMSPSDAWKQGQEKLWPALKVSHACAASELGDGCAQANWMVWSVFHTFNFRFVPLEHQILATAAMSILWSGVLSYMARPPLQAAEPSADSSRM
jgi:hypothetical protein